MNSSLDIDNYNYNYSFVHSLKESALLALGLTAPLILFIIGILGYEFYLELDRNRGKYPTAIWYARDRELGIRSHLYTLSNHEGWRDFGPIGGRQFQEKWFTYPISYRDYRTRADLLSGWVASRDATNHPEEHEIDSDLLDCSHSFWYGFWHWWYNWNRDR